MVEKEGGIAIEAEDGRAGLAALERLGEQRPALILLDLMMPEMDGFQFVEEFRRRSAWQTVPIVVVTAKDLTSEERARLNGSVERVLQKGRYHRDELLREVRDRVAFWTEQRKA